MFSMICWKDDCNGITSCSQAAAIFSMISITSFSWSRFFSMLKTKTYTKTMKPLLQIVLHGRVRKPWKSNWHFENLWPKTTFAFDISPMCTGTLEDQHLEVPKIKKHNLANLHSWFLWKTLSNLSWWTNQQRLEDAWAKGHFRTDQSEMS